MTVLKDLYGNCLNELTFLSAVVTSWFVGVDRADEAITGKKKVQKKDLLPISQVPRRVADENVDIFDIKKYCTAGGWRAVLNMVESVKRLPYSCEVCAKEAETDCVGCDCCLTWWHMGCLGLSKAPSTKFWFCRACYK